MSLDVFGDEYLDHREYARKLVTIGAKKPWIKVISYPVSSGVLLSFCERDTGYPVTAAEIGNKPGVYAIYETLRNGTFSCLYSGTGNVYDRIYRFMKELHGKSRHDEGHPAANKARRDGVNPNHIVFKYLTWDDFPDLSTFRGNREVLDEALAVLLKSRYNVKRIY